MNELTKKAIASEYFRFCRYADNPPLLSWVGRLSTGSTRPITVTYGCISFLRFYPVVRYGVGYFNGGEEVENQGEPTPNAP
ncbi:MAG: hypothetical protein F6J90_15375 [Moorea sp. SIOASIH]|uniref:hypothetical protein n=1 Tax=Moorena sp. SIOASIH TaxID=2607817 RepID=UPI0013BDBF4C|nr:hypothetical protein [Moorena sp. SIOASIH]NEO37635.1 hypothetical protein [Moorena sp. SIOASIH]